MSRIIQIRRGSANEHDNFTGMIGEITMDTDNKTLRVHDGQTIGGIPLARADQINSNSGNIDIETVPDEFWAQIVEKFAPKTFDTIETRTVPINSRCAFLDFIINTDKQPEFIQTTLVCKASDAGYQVGDVVNAFGIGNRTNPIPNTHTDENGLHVCLMVGYEQYWVSHKETGETTYVNDENWDVKFRVYC